jgi:hypothetical protein
MWFKADVTSGDDGMFEIGAFAGAYGEINVGVLGDNLRFKLNGGGWARSVAFTDTGWNHVAVVYATGSEADSKMYLNGIAVGSTTGTFPSSSDMDFAGLKTVIGAYYSSSYPFNGNIDEVAIWDSALTSAQVNDIYNGGVPAALADSPVGWWKFHEDDVDLGGDITDYGSGENDGTLENGAALSRSVPAEDATWNNRSILFDGVDQSMSTTADDTLATKSYSFWAKSSDTGVNRVFDHGDSGEGTLYFNYGGAKILLNLNSNYTRYWVDNSAQDDGAWHHWVVYLEHDNISNCKLYCDGVLQTVDSTYTSDGSGDPYTNGIRIGRGGSYYFDGSLDEFAIFDGELTLAQVLQIYNGGSPADLKEFSPESWWRMGDDDDAGGTTIRDLACITGDNLVTNGSFDGNSSTGWTLGSGWSISSNRANQAGNTDFLTYAAFTPTIGQTYEVQYEIPTYTSGISYLTFGGSYLAFSENSVGAFSYTIRATSAVAFGIYASSFIGSIDNVSIKQINGNPGTLVNTPTFSTDIP